MSKSCVLTMIFDFHWFDFLYPWLFVGGLFTQGWRRWCRREISIALGLGVGRGRLTCHIVMVRIRRVVYKPDSHCGTQIPQRAIMDPDVSAGTGSGRDSRLFREFELNPVLTPVSDWSTMTCWPLVRAVCDVWTHRSPVGSSISSGGSSALVSYEVATFL